MKIDLSFTPSELDELQLRDKNIVVIDVLRSSTTIAVALKNGAREIIPVESIENAVKISGSLFGDVTLRGGERNGKTIQGFNLGNSPSEYSEATVKGKSIIFCTTNGSVAMYKSRFARNLAIGSFVNLTKIVEFIKEVNSDFLLICAGRANVFSSFSLEDAICAGMIVHQLTRNKSLNVELTDSSLAAQAMNKTFGNSLLKIMKNSDHGSYLVEIGFSEDIKLCAALDSVPVLPVLSGNVIKLRKEDARNEIEQSTPNKLSA
ncbi:MAG: 2-phosphosulfolactate phosphatase [Ignavibacteriales bacterium]|nr:2-phosphosulfolactate phosphatase [Ignavibacteriales bacterium]